MRVSVTIDAPVWMRDILERVGTWMPSGGSVRRAFGKTERLVSSYMADNLDLWYEMYLDRPPWADRRVIPLGLPSAIGRELARYALMESSVSFAGGPRADHLGAHFRAVEERALSDLEAGLCLGGIALKPWVDGGRILVHAAWPTQFTPTETDGTGAVIGGVFREVVERDGLWYVRLERHGFRTEGGERRYVIENRACRSDARGAPGAEVPLTEVPDWADLPREAVLSGVDGPLFAWFAPPVSNNVDPRSPVGVSVYAGSTAALIRDADRQWERIAWEYHSGRRKIFTDDIGGASDFANDLFERGRFSKGGTVFEQFSPEFRDDALFRGLDEIFKRIEWNVGLAYGTLSAPPDVEKTATEVAAAKQRQRTTVKGIQKAFQGTLERLACAMDAYATLYGLAPPGDWEMRCDWGDGVLDDAEADRQDKALDMQMVASGLMNAWEFRMKWFREDEETARASLPGMDALTDEGQDEIE